MANVIASDLFWALKIKASDLSQYSQDLQETSTLCKKNNIQQELWGAPLSINFEKQSWIECFTHNSRDNSDFLISIENQGHRFLLDHPLPSNALIYNAQKRELILWRSFNGAALYWSIQKHSLILSNSLCGPMRAGWLALTPDMATLSSYLYLGEVPQDSSLMEGLHKLSPGQGLVFSLVSGALFDFEAQIRAPIEKQNISYNSPLEALWQTQEPQALFFLSKQDSSPFFKEFKDFFNKTSPHKALSSKTIGFITLAITYFTESSRLSKKIRTRLLRLLYKPIEPLIRWMEKRCVFTYQEIDESMFMTDHQSFKPWGFFQQLTHKKLYESFFSWPSEISTQFYRLLPCQQERIDGGKSHFKWATIEENEWPHLIRQLHKSSLIEEGIVPLDLLLDLEISLMKKEPRAQVKASALLALELWLKIFTDLHAIPPSDLENWRKLLD